MNTLDISNALDNWISLNIALKTASEEQCKVLLESEKTGRRRKEFIRRIHGRLNKTRLEREKKELGYD